MSEAEKIREGIKLIVSSVMAYYLALISEGMDKQSALKLTIAFQHSMLVKSGQKDGSVTFEGLDGMGTFPNSN